MASRQNSQRSSILFKKTANRKTVECTLMAQPPTTSQGGASLSSKVRLLSMDHFALRPQKRGGLLGTGTGTRWGGGGGGGGTKEWRLDFGYSPKKTGETVDRRQNNGSVKAVSPRHCPATSALCNCCFNCRAWAESQGQCPLHCWRGTTRRERSPTFVAQLHLPTHDLFWANLKVQLHLPPLDLLIFWSRLEPWTIHEDSAAYMFSIFSLTVEV